MQRQLAQITATNISVNNNKDMLTSTILYKQNVINRKAIKNAAILILERKRYDYNEIPNSLGDKQSERFIIFELFSFNICSSNVKLGKNTITNLYTK